MNPTIWLQQHEPGFDRLSAEERASIEHFTLLWGLFEFSLLGTNGSAKRIAQVVAELAERHGPLLLHGFEEPIAHFRRRYYDGEDFTASFDGLKLRDTDKPALVRLFVTGEARDEAETLLGLLIIVLRLRNNLFHGIKWAYGIQGQLDNFRQANVVLMRAIDLHRAGVP